MAVQYPSLTVAGNLSRVAPGLIIFVLAGWLILPPGNVTDPVPTPKPGPGPTDPVPQPPVPGPQPPLPGPTPPMPSPIPPP
ncbi:MAG: hypothetical protein H0X01_06855 [Nitrospira sp.]|nr:hypothetical protein [Nitrospira sp.]